MLIELENNLPEKVSVDLYAKLLDLGFRLTEVKTQSSSFLIGHGEGRDIRSVGLLPGVKNVYELSEPNKLVSSKWRLDPTVIDLGEGVLIGNGNFGMMAGPCSIEGEKQIEHTVEHLIKNNVRIMRGGVFKPRSSPYSFRGLGLEGLKMFFAACQANGIKIITEVMQIEQVESMYKYVDIFQVGARNSQNFNLLEVLGRVDKPVMLKRGLSGTIEELLASAEYVFSSGNEKILLCERGIRTYENAYRNTLDLNAVPILKERSHLPVIVDPSHGIGIRKHVERMALAGVMAGADGLIVEVHENPEKALSDGQQSLNFDEAERLYQNLRILNTMNLKSEEEIVF
ncbi:3-deoxy-7-phosphoheptulonate synthase [Xanthovirga aplysinae]|uniref:3-deoxy-7-phosphoheptulonate synthase n=1 Tax=Xanthovirga aplysinae TaxID=2529853 RepID=UPI0012BD0D8B|nr:3-deoxy-7-phosphoheptulonate synthase [Xanthovirga aplysinae]MTI33332.1 3-deoxy-7-phosphoheptulonate synthase [Xanthovirga aplysinae]